jgi:uncharacterized protein (TIGR02246 family)
VILLGLAATLAGGAAWAKPTRPIVITVDDLPIASGRLHRDAEERERITHDLLAVLDRHGIRAVGLVPWRNVRGERDEVLLRMWLEAGHELGNHSYSHLDYTRTEPEEFIADVERGREALAEFLEPFGRQIRFFRFPMLHEGDTPEKLAAVREYLAVSGQRNLPVTIDNPDWSFEQPWVRSKEQGDEAALAAVGEDYLASLRVSVGHHERTCDRIFDRPVGQILLLHANEIGAARWDELFTWLEATGHRFAAVDEVLADPAYDVRQDFVGPAGYGLWDRIAAERRAVAARAEVIEMLQAQAGAWSDGDLDAFCSVYAADATFLSPTGLTRGRDEILQRYRTRYADRSAMGRLTFEVLEVEPLGGREVSMLGDAKPSEVHGVSVAARWTLSYADREEATGLTLLVLRRQGDRWIIIQDASM